MAPYPAAADCRFLEPTMEEALVVHVHEFVPKAEGEELEQRIALLKARDYAAMLRGQTNGYHSYQHACDAHEIAGEYVYADAHLTDLKLAVSYARNLVQAAMIAEQLEAEGAVS